MVRFFIHWFLVTLIFAMPFQSDAMSCGDLFASQRAEFGLPETNLVETLANDVAKIGCDVSCVEPSKRAQKVAAALSASFQKYPKLKRHARAYAIMIATMIATSYVTSKVTGSLPAELDFIKYSVLGVAGMFVVGIVLPITEPASAKYRQFAYGLKAEATTEKKSVTAVMLHRVWLRTQAWLSLNEQMSRNLMSPVFLQIDLGFSSAREAMRAGDESLAVDQIAMLAVRLRRFYRDLEPADADIAEAIRANFTRHVSNPGALETKIRERIEKSDPEATEFSAHAHYDRLLEAWLSPER